ncbi:MAG TPA: lysostaphin resistance A-like protein, partial [Candidatus Brocadiaceae bacterium]
NQKAFSVDNFTVRHYHFTMNFFADLKQYKKILFLFLLILCLSSLIAPIIKAILDTAVTASPFMEHLLKFKEGSYDFGRVMRRIMMAAAVLIIFLFRKPLMIGSFATIGLKNTHGWWNQLHMGFLLGTGIFILYTFFLFAHGTKTLHIEAKPFSNLAFRLIKILIAAGLVGCIEEIFFRGFIFQSVLKDMSAIFAVCFSSIFYSLLHFFKVKLLVFPGFQPFIGFFVIYQSFKGIVSNLNDILPSLIGLFLVGVVLAYACLRTKSLYLAIGLHAGWVFLMKTNGIFFDHVGSNTQWLFGDSNAVTGVLGWILLIVTLILIRFMTKVSIDGKNTARTG